MDGESRHTFQNGRVYVMSITITFACNNTEIARFSDSKEVLIKKTPKPHYEFVEETAASKPLIIFAPNLLRETSTEG